MSQTMERLTARIAGDVQGVGYRAFARRCARSYGLTGYTRNMPDGTVEVVAEGPRGLLEDLLTALRRGPVSAEVSEARAQWGVATGDFATFSIRFS